MNRAIQSLFFITGVIFEALSQFWIWNLPNEDKLIPYLLSSIACVLIAIYLKENNNKTETLEELIKYVGNEVYELKKNKQ